MTQMKKKPKIYLQNQYADPNNRPDLPEEDAAYERQKLIQQKLQKKVQAKKRK